jgi:hypothetical protein
VKTQNFTLVFEAPSVVDFLQLRAAVGWTKINAKLVKQSLINSLFYISAYHNQQLVGMGRIVGDGALYSRCHGYPNTSKIRGWHDFNGAY